MSLRAAMRSKRDSSTGESDSTEDRETEEEVRDEWGDAYGEEWACWSFSSTISTLTMAVAERCCVALFVTPTRQARPRIGAEGSAVRPGPSTSTTARVTTRREDAVFLCCL